MNDDMEGVKGKNEKQNPEVSKVSKVLVKVKTEPEKPEVANVSCTVSLYPVLVPVSICPVLGTVLGAVRCFH
jgi:hypothetical protein